MKRQKTGRSPLDETHAAVLAETRPPMSRGHEALLALQQQAGNRATASIFAPPQVQRYQSTPSPDLLGRTEAARSTPEDAISGTVKGWIVVARPAGDKTLGSGWTQIPQAQVPPPMAAFLGGDSAWVRDGTSSGGGQGATSGKPAQHAEQQLVRDAEKAGVPADAEPGAVGSSRILGLYTERQPCTTAENCCHRYLTGKLHGNTPVFYSFTFDAGGLDKMERHKLGLLIAAYERIFTRNKDAWHLSDEAVRDMTRDVGEYAEQYFAAGKNLYTIKGMADKMIGRLLEDYAKKPEPEVRPEPVLPAETKEDVQPPARQSPVSSSPFHFEPPPTSSPGTLAAADAEMNETPARSAAPPGRTPLKAHSFVMPGKATQPRFGCGKCRQPFTQKKAPEHYAPSALEFQLPDGSVGRQRVRCPGSKKLTIQIG